MEGCVWRKSAIRKERSRVRAVQIDRFKVFGRNYSAQNTVSVV